MRPRLGMLLIIIAAAGLYLIGNDRAALWDRDEPRYAQTSRQMLESGDWVVPRLLDEVRTAKPPLVYWCQAASMGELGVSEFSARLPSVLAMVVLLAVVAYAAHREVGPTRALWTVLILASAGLTIAAAKMCLTDAILLLWLTLAQMALFAIYRGSRSLLPPLGLWIAIALSGLTKGPVVLGVLLATMLVLAMLDVGRRRWRSPSAWRTAIRWWPQTRPLLGVAVLAGVLGPWLYEIEQHSPGFVRQALLHDVLERSTRPLEGHTGPPGYYLLTIWGTFYPWSLLMLTGLTMAWRHRGLVLSRYALAAVLGPWVMFELVQTKLPHYILAVFPALSLLTADALVRCARGQHDDLARRRFAVMAAVWAGATVLVAIGPWAPIWLIEQARTDRLIWSAAAMGIIGLAYAAVVAVLWLRGRIYAAAAVMGAGMFVLISILYAGYLAGAPFLRISPEVAAALGSLDGIKPGEIRAIGYKEDSLAFYSGGRVRNEGDNDYLTRHPPESWPRYLILRGDVWDRTPAALRERLQTLGVVQGIAYADDPAQIEVRVVRKTDAPPPEITSPLPAPR